MMIPTLTAAVFLSMGAGVPPPIVIPQGQAVQQPAPGQQLESLSMLVGEWEGQLRVTTDAGTSVSLVGLSAQQDLTTQEVTLGFQGLAFAAPIEGIARLAAHGTDTLTATWYDTLSDSTVLFTDACASDLTRPSVALESISLRSNQTLRQTVTLESEGHALIEITAHQPGQPAITLLSMDLYRLPSGQLSMGTGLCTSRELLAKLGPSTTTNPNTATANVNPDAE